MKLTIDQIRQEGFAVLSGKWGGGNTPKTIIGLNAKRSNGGTIGYLAYPSPKLKNDIPVSRFYTYNNLITRRYDSQIAPSKKLDMSYKTYGHLMQSVTKSQYIKKIKQVKELLAAGEIYQMNYAIRFRKKFEGDPYAFFLKMQEINPSDFSAYLNCGDFQIISSSPERLFKVSNGKIITQPIKGTAPKDSGARIHKSAESLILNPESFQGEKSTDQNLVELLNSDKERTELDMITDLERNDVGKICKYGTLKLTKEREVLELKNIWHTYSQVEGKLESGLTSDEIINAMFPGGSITGCPKKRAMKYIEEFENLPRNIFTGSIGLIHSEAGSKRSGSTAKQVYNWDMDFNICIRTALVQNGYVEYWAGGGIVADSEPESEYEECLLKAERFLSVL